MAVVGQIILYTKLTHIFFAVAPFLVDRFLNRSKQMIAVLTVFKKPVWESMHGCRKEA